MSQIRGVNVPMYPLARTGEVTTLNTFKRLYDDLQAVGGNAVMLNPVQYVYVPRGSVAIAKPPAEYRDRRLIWPAVGQGEKPWAQTISPDLLYLALLEAKARGLFAGLKPMVDIEYGGWRGYLSVEGMAKAFLRSYKYDFLRPYVEMAKAARADLFVLGTEMYTVTKELGPGWADQVREYAVRTLRFPYLTTYAANWGAIPDAEFMRLTSAWFWYDYVGVDAYFPLVGVDVPVDDWYEEAVFRGWRAPIQAMNAVCNDETDALMFTEIGYRADTLAAVDPYADPGAGTYSPEAQVACWRAFRRLEPRAYFAWSYDLFPQHADPRSHNLRGRGEAERVALGESY